MATIKYKDFFNTERWLTLLDKVCTRAQIESCVITGIPSCGKRLFLKCVQENYAEITNDKDSILISLEFLPSETSIESMNKKLLMELREKITDKSLRGITDFKILVNELVNRGRKILIMINKFERLATTTDSLEYIESLGFSNPYSVRFIIGCDISCLARPEMYGNKGNLPLINQFILKPFNETEAEEQIIFHKKIFGWQKTEKLKEQIFTMTGGVPGLLKHVSKYVDEIKTEELTTKVLLADAVVNLKVKQIFDRMAENDLIVDGEFNLKYKDILLKLGMIDENNKGTVLLLNDFMKSERGGDFKKDLKKELSAQEYKLFKIFENSFDDLITLEDLSLKLWESTADVEYSMWATYKLISNLNKKIKDKGYSIKNFRGRGYMLLEK